MRNIRCGTPVGSASCFEILTSREGIFMLLRALICALLLCSILIGSEAASTGYAAEPRPPKAGKVELFPESAIRPGMKAIAWTVFQGFEPEQVPVEIIGVWQNMWGPQQDIIIGKLSGKAARTNVAGGMSGSPVYIDGKLVGAISLRLSVFSPDAICGITPIQLMLDVKNFDQTRPLDARTPGKLETANTETLPDGLLGRVLSSARNVSEAPTMTQIATPITMSGFSDETVRQF